MQPPRLETTDKTAYRADEPKLMTGITLSSESIENRNTLASVVKSIIEETEMETEDIEIHSGIYDPDWSRGDPCPHCGGEVFSVMVLNDEIYGIEDGKLEFHKKGEAVGQELSYFCQTCDELVQEVPYKSLL